MHQHKKRPEMTGATVEADVSSMSCFWIPLKRSFHYITHTRKWNRFFFNTRDSCIPSNGPKSICSALGTNFLSPLYCSRQRGHNSNSQDAFQGSRGVEIINRDEKECWADRFLNPLTSAIMETVRITAEWFGRSSAAERSWGNHAVL